MKKSKLYKVSLTESEIFELYQLCASKVASYEVILDSNPEDYDANVACSIYLSILNKFYNSEFDFYES